MTRIITRLLKENEDGIPGYIAFPEREEKGPGLLLIHQHSGLTGYLKTAAYRFAQLGYATVIPNLCDMLGYPAETHIDKGTEIQNKIEIQFVAVGDQLDPVMHLGANLLAIHAGSLVHASNFLRIALPLFWVIPKILSGCFVHVAAMLYPGTPFDLFNNQIPHKASCSFLTLTFYSPQNR